MAMKYIAIVSPGAASGMSLVEGDIPALGFGEVLIRVQAAGVNRPDILQRQGLYPPPPDASPVLGLEVAGEILACGENALPWKPGDRVCALINGGGYADFAIAPAAHCLPIPDTLTYLEAAALPETLFTVWHNLWQRARLVKGESLLVHAGASGIGTIAIQLAVALGIKVYVTAGSAEKCLACQQLGAIAINYREQDFVSEIKQLTQGEGVDVILDIVGGDYIQRNFSAAAKEARIVNIAFLQGSKTRVDFMPLMLKRLTLTGSTLRAQSADVKAKIAAELKETVWPLLSCGIIKPVIDSVFPLEQVIAAHERMESNLHIGKIMLEVHHDK